MSWWFCIGPFWVIASTIMLSYGGSPCSLWHICTVAANAASQAFPSCSVRLARCLTEDADIVVWKACQGARLAQTQPHLVNKMHSFAHKFQHFPSYVVLSPVSNSMRTLPRVVEASRDASHLLCQTAPGKGLFRLAPLTPITNRNWHALHDQKPFKPNIPLDLATALSERPGYELRHRNHFKRSNSARVWDKIWCIVRRVWDSFPW